MFTVSVGNRTNGAKLCQDAAFQGDTCSGQLLIKTGLPPVCSQLAWLCLQVATARVAKAVKAEIPCVDDLVSKLEDIGEKTCKKLMDVQVAAETAGVYDLLFPDRSITTGKLSAQHSTAHHDAAQYSMAQHSTARDRSAWHSTA